jgi:hypothetical protein
LKLRNFEAMHFGLLRLNPAQAAQRPNFVSLQLWTSTYFNYTQNRPLSDQT